MIDNPPYLQLKHSSAIRHDEGLFTPINLDIFQGESIQIIGANGSGKTSLLRTIVGLLPLIQGEIFWQGKKILTQDPDYRQIFYYLDHRRANKSYLTVYENIRSQYNKQQLTAMHEIVEQWKLNSLLKYRCRELSAGQQQRLAFIKLVLSRKQCWLLDEPFADLDEEGKKLLYQLFFNKLKTGITIIFTSHIANIEECLPNKQLFLRKE